MEGDAAAATTRTWMTACAAGCLIFVGSLAAVAWQVQLSIIHGLESWGSERTWLGLPDVLEWLDRPGGRAILLPTALIVPLVLPIRRSRHRWLLVAVLLGSWALGSTAAAALGYLAPGRDGVAFPDGNIVTAVAFMVTCAHLIQRSLIGRLAKGAFWGCGTLVIGLAGLDPIVFDPGHTLPLSGVAGVGLRPRLCSGRRLVGRSVPSTISMSSICSVRFRCGPHLGTSASSWMAIAATPAGRD
jgi:hypothetical protein